LKPCDPECVVLHQGALGDFLLTLPVIQAAGSAVGASRVTAIASARSARLAAGRSAIDRHIFPDAVGLHTLFAIGLSVDERLRSVLSDASGVVSFLGDVSSDVHDRLTNVAGGQVYGIDPRPRLETLNERCHITSQWCRDLMKAGLGIGALTPTRIHLDPCDSLPLRCTDLRHVNSDWTAGHARPRMVIHPGSGGRSKCWPIERFTTLVDAMGIPAVTWLLGPAEMEITDLVERIRARAARRGEACLLDVDLETAARSMAEADVYVGNDAGTTHLAAALGVYTVAIFGPTDPLVWGPIGKRVRVIATDQPGEPIENIAVEPVMAALPEGIRRR
jgi:ADP-heptose:LPS heptosyltransferase